MALSIILLHKQKDYASECENDFQQKGKSCFPIFYSFYTHTYDDAVANGASQSTDAEKKARNVSSL